VTLHQGCYRFILLFTISRTHNNSTVRSKITAPIIQIGENVIVILESKRTITMERDRSIAILPLSTGFRFTLVTSKNIIVMIDLAKTINPTK
jgi:hypothetical protein